MNNTVEIKKELHHYIDLADERMANALLAMFKTYFQSKQIPTVAYTTKGEALTKEQMIKEVMEAVEDVEKGNFLSSDQIRKAIKKS